MHKFINFLHTKVYRRTFILYLVIVFFFLSIVLGVMGKNVHIIARNNFVQKASEAFRSTDQQAEAVTTSIDRFLAQLYTSPNRLQDFYLFFGSSPEDYLRARLDQDLYLDLTYLDSCNSLILESQYAIRHMLYYSRENMVDMEYSRQGFSRMKIVSPQEVQQITRTGCIYQKDIHNGSNYLGKISFVLDLPQLSRSYFTQTTGQACYLVLPEHYTQLGQVGLSHTQLTSILESGKSVGTLDLGNSAAYYAVYASEHLPYSMIFLSPARQFLAPQLNQMLVIFAGVLMGFTAITLLLIHRFSRDASYLDAILGSMAKAEHSDFTPLAITGKNDEFDSIVTGLNRLYAHLDSLIQQEYKLTISQQKAQMDMLSAQLSPHFLYNTLERIRMRAVLEHAPDVAEGTAGLGLLYRNIVKTEPVITIGRELEITTQYLDLMTFLYGDQFLYHIDVDPAIEALKTPKIWMQPIVENFFKHNFQQDDRVKIIVIEGEQTRDHTVLRFFDNIGSLSREQLEALNEQLRTDSDDSSGIGLRNVVHRLRLFYGKDVSMTAENNDPAGICFSITLKKEAYKDVSTADRR